LRNADVSRDIDCGIGFRRLILSLQRQAWQWLQWFSTARNGELNDSAGANPTLDKGVTLLYTGIVRTMIESHIWRTIILPLSIIICFFGNVLGTIARFGQVVGCR